MGWYGSSPNRSLGGVYFTLLMFLVALGVPIIWEKLALGSSLSWLGWEFHWSSFSACLPQSKRDKLMHFLSQLLLPGKSIERKLIEQGVGLLLWFCGGAYWLKPWLQQFYTLLYKRHCTFRSLSLGHFGALLQNLSPEVWLTSSLPQCDLLLGWKLHSVGNCSVTSLESPALVTPKLKHGCVDCVVFNYQHPEVTGSQASAHAARLFYNADVPLRFVDIDQSVAAADAFATKDYAGLGGWWVDRSACVNWFSFQITWDDLPKWFRTSSSMQSCIAALEALAQLVLLLILARATTQQVPSRLCFVFINFAITWVPPQQGANSWP